jgi:hypothetical protein
MAVGCRLRPHGEDRRRARHRGRRRRGVARLMGGRGRGNASRRRDRGAWSGVDEGAVAPVAGETESLVRGGRGGGGTGWEKDRGARQLAVTDLDARAEYSHGLLQSCWRRMVEVELGRANNHGETWWRRTKR